MIISQTRLQIWQSNKEKARITYPWNLEPLVKGRGLQRGGALHLLIEGRFKGWRDIEVAQMMLDNDINDSDAVREAEWMYPAFLSARDNRGVSQQESEKDIEVPIGDKHSIRVILDEVCQDMGRVKIGDFKTTVEGFWCTPAALQKQWDNDIQVDFGLIGAKHMGIDTNEALITTIIAPKNGGDYKVEFTCTSRTDEQLERTKRWANMEADTMEMYEERFGIEDPWPHTPHLDKWCKKDCPFRELCEKPASQWDLSFWQQRKERSKRV